MDIDNVNDDILPDDIILDLSNEDLLQEVGDPARGSTPPPSKPAVPQPIAAPSMLEELATTIPPFLFLNDSVLPHREPLQPEVVPQPQLSQSELAAVRTAWQGIDSLRMAMESQGAQLAAVTSRMHSAEQEVQNLKRAAADHPEDKYPEVKKFCVEEAVSQIVHLNEEKRLSIKRAASQQTLTSQERKRRGLAPAAPPR